MPPYSVNQRLPSGPAVMPCGLLLAVSAAANSVMVPAGVIRPILLPPSSVNQRLPSGPAVIRRAAVRRGDGNSVTTPAGRDPADPVAGDLGEPEVAVRPGRDAVRAAVRGGDRELGDRAGGRDPADLVAGVLGEPEVAVRPRRDPGGPLLAVVPANSVTIARRA